MMSRRDTPGRVAVLFIIGLSIGPMAYGLIYGLFYALGGTGLLNRSWSLDPVLRVLASPETWKSILFSMWIAGVSLLISASVSLTIVLHLTSRAYSRIARTLLMMSVSIPSVVVGFVIFQWFSASGWVFRFMPIDSASGLVADPMCIGIVMGHIVFGVPILSLLFLALYDATQIDRLRQTAVSLGCSRIRGVFEVAIPVLLGRARSNLVLLGIAFFGSYELPWLLGRQSPEMISVMIYRKFALFDLTDKPEAFALSFLFTLIVGVVVFWLFKGQTLDTAVGLAESSDERLRSL